MTLCNKKFCQIFHPIRPFTENLNTITDMALCNHYDRIDIPSGSSRLFWRHLRNPTIILGLGWDRDTLVTDNFGEWNMQSLESFLH